MCITIEKYLDKYLQQFENVLSVAQVSTVVVDILNIYCKPRWTIFYLELPRI
jgi:hypothetical protein